MVYIFILNVFIDTAIFNLKLLCKKNIKYFLIHK